ncbi:MAG: type III-A CRISPR-associated protein Cas10/Csm1 [Thermodesulfobacteriota bacterium]
MAYTMDEVVIGALLHDIGKFMQRAAAGNQELREQSLKMESALCPTDGKGRYTHKHVLWTDAFFDWLEREGLWFPQGIRLNAVRTFAGSHHLPDSPRGEAAMGWISALSDRYSSGMDRKPSPEESGTGTRGWGAFRRTPQQCIFDHVILDAERLGKPGRNAVKLVPMDASDADSIMPDPWPAGNLDDRLPSMYASLWQRFCKGLGVIAAAGLSPRLFEEAILGLLERYTWAIPSSTVDMPDISLYDHSRTSAAIAACLFRHHEERDELNDQDAVKDRNRAKFRLLAGDLSGIQSTLFTLRRQGVKGVNKILRARSFLIGSIAESACLSTITRLGIPFCCILQQAGGRFLLMLPELSQIEPIVEQIRREIDAWLLERYTGSLALNLALSKPFGGASFQVGPFGELIAALRVLLDDAKLHPLSTCAQGVLKMEYPFDQACAACGVRPARNDKEDDGRCETCQAEFALGTELPHAGYISWLSSPQRGPVVIEVLGQQLVLGRNPPASSQIPFLLSARAIGNPRDNEPWAGRFLANYVPTFSNPEQLHDRRYKGLEVSDDMSRIGLKTFEHIAAEALEWDSKADTYRGKAFLALLKADVDRLGFVFSHGLEEHAETGSPMGGSMFSLSRLVQLSRMMDLYFTGYLPGLLRREFPDTYIVYAGGDDLLVIGPWYQSLHLATRIQETFASCTGKNPNITISTGLSLMHPNHPVTRAVEEAEVFLDQAKSGERNHISAVCGGDVPWAHYADILKNAEWVHRQINEPDYPVSTGFVHSILRLSDDASAAAQGDVSKAGWRAKLAYHLARNVKGKDKDDGKRRRTAWLRKLGFDETFNPMEDIHGIINWRLALSIALYRNRT